MTRVNKLITRTAVVMVAGLAACGEGGQVTAPLATHPVAVQPGRLVVSLEGADAGGVMLTIAGAGITEPTSASTQNEMFTRAPDGATPFYRIAIVGERISGALLSFGVPDVSHIDAYQVTLVQVASDDNTLKALDTYKLSVQPQKE